MNQDANTPVIVIHGGAGTILREKLTADLEEEIRVTLEGSLKIGFAILQRGGSALDAVQRAVNVMEDSPLFNAGKGAVFTHDGHNEQDATIIDGASGEVGSVALLRGVKNPINLARMVLSSSPHVLLAGEGAEAFAISQGMALVDDKYFFTDRRYKQLKAVQLAEKKDPHSSENKLRLSEDDRSGTVGAVALDTEGNLAAATSSGGMTNKRWGRIGDSALVGAGTWADEQVAVSTTGHGEFFMRGVIAYDLSARMRYAGLSLSEACVATMKRLGPKGTGGFIAVDRGGNIELPFNTSGMYRGFLRNGHKPQVAIFEE